MTVAAQPRHELEEILELTSSGFDEALARELAAAGEPAYRSRQVRQWVFSRTPASFDAMSDLPKRLREQLGAAFTLHPLALRLEQTSTDGTRKFLWTRADGGTIESVLIPEPDRTTYCISTQSGCPVKCTFCATGYGGFDGNLRAAEIVDQVLLLRLLTGAPPTNLVYMGMGEPLLNFAAVARSLEVLTHPGQVGMGARRITVSTVGIPDRIRELGERFPQVKLALSLHAARDELRDEIIPLNRKHPLGAVLEAVRDHVRLTGKKATFEYIVLPGVNDSPADALALARLVKGIPGRINLIGFNPFPGAPYSRPAVKRLLELRAAIGKSYPGEVTIRRSRGEDIQGACGQLSLKHALLPAGEEDPPSRASRSLRASPRIGPARVATRYAPRHASQHPDPPGV